MEKLDPKKDGATLDIVKQNIEKMKEIFPDVFTEGKVDFDALRQTLGDDVDDREEHYSLTWNGKTQARRIAQMSSTGTLLPCPKESVNWNETQNLFIEGDNLEVLKLLQKSYDKKVKMIYIDPPYNTGKEFIYPDKFQDNLDTYLRYSGQIDDSGFRIAANTESSGRYHTNWLNMMLPRLRLARNLLTEDGLFFVSISDHEVANLKLVCDEIFGEENLLGVIEWNSTKSVTNTALVSVGHTHNLVYASSLDHFVSNRQHFRLPESGNGFSNPDNDPRGPWKADPFQVGGWRPNQQYEIVNPVTGEKYKPNTGCSWKNDHDKFKELMEDGRIVFGVSGEAGPQRKRFLSEATERGRVAKTWWEDVGTTTSGTQAVKELFDGVSVFTNPKPVDLIRRMIQLGDHSGSGLILDFFAGSCSTGHAVIEGNAEEGANRRYILIQLPEPCDEESQAFKAGYKTISDVGKERLRRALSLAETKTNSGFKVFRLSSSNVKQWDADFDNFEDSVYSAADSLKEDRLSQDFLYELLLKFGIDLCVPIDERTIAKKTVFSVGGGALVACFDEAITLEVVEGIVELKKELQPEIMRVVFRDSGFKDDVVKTNAVQILKQAGLSNEHIRSI